MFRGIGLPTADQVRWFVGVPVRPQTYLNLVYLGLAFPLGIAYFAFVTVGLSLGIGLALLVVGIPILLLVVLGALGIAAFERWLADLLLDSPVTKQSASAPQSDDDTTAVEEPGSGSDASTAPDDQAADAAQPAPRSPVIPQEPVFATAATSIDADAEADDDRSLTRRVTAVLLDTDTWKAVAFLPLKFVFGIAAMVAMFTALSTGVSMLLTPLYYSEPGLYVGIVTDRPVELHPTLHVGWNRLLITLETVITIGFWRIERLWQALVVAGLGGLLTLSTLHILNGVAALAGRATNWLLRDAYSPFDAV